MENKKPFTAVVITILIIAVLALGGFVIYDKFIKEEPNTEEPGKNPDDNKPKPPVQLQRGTFKKDIISGNDYYYGTVQVEGYATIKTLKECHDEYISDTMADCENVYSYDYVFFNILRTENNDFERFVQDRVNKFWMDNNAVGLGCMKNNVIEWNNYFDGDHLPGEETQLSLSTSDTAKILNSTKSNPIILELEKLKMTEGIEVYGCYSDITKIRFP